MFSIILNFIIVNIIYGVNSVNLPITTENIEFELEVLDTVKVEPVFLDFGNILKNSNVLQTKVTYFNLAGAYKQDMLLTTKYSEGTVEGEYTKIQVLKKKSGIAADVLDVYLYNINSRILTTGEYKIPIIGEIREVKDIGLGEYEKTIRMDVELQPISPII